MRKIVYIILSLILILIAILFIGKFISKPELYIMGFYQSEFISGYIVQVSFFHDYTFSEYIDNREVNKGTFEKVENSTYRMNGDKRNIEITLNDDNDFEIIINKINGINPILMKKLDNMPTVFSTAFDDLDEYKTLLD